MKKQCPDRLQFPYGCLELMSGGSRSDGRVSKRRNLSTFFFLIRIF